MHHLSKPIPFTHWFLAILLASLFLVAASAKYMKESWWWGSENGPAQTACTQEAIVCPDGSVVGRTGPNCKFEACAITDDQLSISNQIDTSDWKTYRNEEYGFEVRYPEKFHCVHRFCGRATR